MAAQGRLFINPHFQKEYKMQKVKTQSTPVNASVARRTASKSIHSMQK
jgi:hypothetical protein